MPSYPPTHMRAAARILRASASSTPPTGEPEIRSLAGRETDVPTCPAHDARGKRPCRTCGNRGPVTIEHEHAGTGLRSRSWVDVRNVMASARVDGFVDGWSTIVTRRPVRSTRAREQGES